MHEAEGVRLDFMDAVIFCVLDVVWLTINVSVNEQSVVGPFLSLQRACLFLALDQGKPQSHLKRTVSYNIDWRALWIIRSTIVFPLGAGYASWLLKRVRLLQPNN